MLFEFAIFPKAADPMKDGDEMTKRAASTKRYLKIVFK